MIQKATSPKVWMTVSEMAAAVGLCRDRFYDMVRAGTFPSPVYGLRNHRPFYTPELQAICVVIRAQGIGFDRKVVFFNKVRRNEQVEMSPRPPNGRGDRWGTIPTWPWPSS